MRNAVCQALVALSQRRRFAFLTGDLGFMALEPLRDAMGELFINAGVAEQNMVSVAAGMASEGLPAWVYSIAPFAYARPFEQIRNDVCSHKLNVKIVGNGGGYAYGSMGATHHALEDYGAMLCLPHMRAYVPAFGDDVAPVVDKMADTPSPGYLRLGRCEKPAGFGLPPYAGWRKIVSGGGPVIAAIGPIAGGFIGKLTAMDEQKRPALWVVTELPLEHNPPPPAFAADVKKSGALHVVEEHVAHGGLGEALARVLALMGSAPAAFGHFHAKGYLSGRFGSQQFHRKECGIDADTALAVIMAER
ncbi:MAG: transketolase [Nitrospinae bacterium]|nr:transketolase [Nitrospinota bacterium]